MTDRSLPVSGSVTFEELKKTNEHGAEFWSARELQPLLGYGQWRRFEDAINRAMVSCGQSGNAPENHFAGAGKMVVIGSGSNRKVDDFHLSRFACYLIAQNGDPRKPEIAAAQKYFAIQAFRMTQTRDKLARTPAKDQQQAIRTHEAVGREVREAIKRIGGAMPENIPPVEHISQVEKRIKNTPPFLELDGNDAKGLIGTNGE